jgi:hypothetical protein
VKAPSQNIEKLNILKVFGALKPTSITDRRCRDSMVIVFVLIVIYKQGGCGHCHMVVSYLLRLPI